MRWNKLTILTCLLVPGLFVINSCETDDVVSPKAIYSKTNIVLNSAQEVPTNTSTATGMLNVSYSRATRILTYSFTWTGLTGPPTAGHIHGLSPAGFNSAPVQTFSGLTAATAGSYSGTLLIDGVKVKEEDILNGLYYVNIHTAANTGGEIRGQIIFN